MSFHRGSRAVAMLILLLSVFAAPVLAAAAAGPAGHWEGAIEVPGTKLGIDVDLAQEGDALEGDISIPLQNAKDLPLTSFKVEGSTVEFAIQGAPGTPTIALTGDTLTVSLPGQPVLHLVPGLAGAATSPAVISHMYIGQNNFYV